MCGLESMGWIKYLGDWPMNMPNPSYFSEAHKKLACTDGYKLKYISVCNVYIKKWCLWIEVIMA